RLTQPLLKGFAFSIDVPWAEVLRAEFASERARQEVRAAMISTVHSTEDAYWDLVQALKTHQIQGQSLQLAEQQLTLTRRQIDAGILPPSDLISAEGTHAQRQLGAVQSESAVAQAADQLRHVLNLSRDGWSQPILPLEPPRFTEQVVSF